MIDAKKNNYLSFLGILVTMNPDGSLVHQIYRKKTHSNKYFHANSHHQPTQKTKLLNTLVKRVIKISDKEHLEQGLEHLSMVFERNGY
jgi:hypothetical protein